VTRLAAATAKVATRILEEDEPFGPIVRVLADGSVLRQPADEDRECGLPFHLTIIRRGVVTYQLIIVDGPPIPIVPRPDVEPRAPDEPLPVAEAASRGDERRAVTDQPVISNGDERAGVSRFVVVADADERAALALALQGSAVRCRSVGPVFADVLDGWAAQLFASSDDAVTLQSPFRWLQRTECQQLGRLLGVCRNRQNQSRQLPSLELLAREASPGDLDEPVAPAPVERRGVFM
jgi:hypothetical protein